MQGGVVASVVLLKKRSQSTRNVNGDGKPADDVTQAVDRLNAHDKVVRTKAELPASAVATSILASIVENIHRKRHYLNLCTHIMFVALFLGVVFSQRDTSTAFNVERVITDNLFSEDVVRTEFEDTTHFYNWWKDRVAAYFPAVPCGDSVCTAPQEFMAWDRFGCAADCGTFPNTTTVNVTFFYSFLGDPNAEPVEWNLCNNDFKVCLFAEDERITNAQYLKPYLRQVSLTDGQWQLKLKSPRIGVGVSIVDASLNSTDNGTITYLSFKTDECVQYNQTEVTYVDDARDEYYAEDDDAGGGGGGNGTAPPGPPPYPADMAADARRLKAGDYLCSAACTDAMFENDVCDLECNSYACDYDRGMCCAPIKRPEFVAFDLSNYRESSSERVPLFLPSDDPKDRMVGRNNLIVGGALLSQTRMQSGACSVITGASMAGSCMTSEPEVSSFGVDPVYLSTSALYNKDEAALGTSEYYTSDQLNTQGTPYGFHPLQGPDSQDFAVFWDVNVAANRALQLVKYMEEGFFVDEQTKSLNIEFVTFNAEVNLFAYVFVRADFHESGRILMFWDVSSLDLEPWSEYSGRVVLEVILGICIMFHALFLLRDVFWPRGGKHAASQHVFWAILEFTNLGFMAVSFVARIVHYVNVVEPFSFQTRYELYGERVWTNREAAQPFMLETNEAEYQKLRVMLNEVKSIADFQDTYLSMSGVIVMLLILRLLKLLDFQPRLGLVTRTLARAAADLSHFSMLFVAVVGGFSITGHVLFGSRLEDFKTMGMSIITCLEVLVGEIQVNEELLLLHNSRFMGQIFFWSFVFICFFLLINVLLAIIVEAYVEVKKAALATDTVPTELVNIAREVAHRYAPCKSKKAASKSVSPSTMAIGGATGDTEQKPEHRTDRELLRWLLSQFRTNEVVWAGLDADVADNAQIEATGKSSRPSRSLLFGNKSKHVPAPNDPERRASVSDLFRSAQLRHAARERALPVGGHVLLNRDSVAQVVMQRSAGQPVVSADGQQMVNIAPTAAESQALLDNLMLRFGEIVTAEDSTQLTGSPTSRQRHGHGHAPSLGPHSSEGVVPMGMPLASTVETGAEKKFVALQELEAQQSAQD